MLRVILFLLLVAPVGSWAADEGGPLISIASPDLGSTYVYGSIKSRALIWNDKAQTFSAEVTFQDTEQTVLQASDDTLRFRIPGITFDKAHGIFYATSKTGEAIPIARKQKTFFLTSIAVLPNAVVRVFHNHGHVSVMLEAIRPSDVGHVASAPSTETNSMGQHVVNVRDLLR